MMRAAHTISREVGDPAGLVIVVDATPGAEGSTPTRRDNTHAGEGRGHAE
jgi:hypothetical protein